VSSGTDPRADPPPQSAPGGAEDPQAGDQVAARSPATESAPRAGNMLPGRTRRRFLVERLLVRVIATCGIVAIGIAIGAILTSSNTKGWIIGLVVAAVSVVLSGVLWSSREV
jgi:hypothetical protein